eukprot:3694782-Rhodomonas_salina.1
MDDFADKLIEIRYVMLFGAACAPAPSSSAPSLSLLSPPLSLSLSLPPISLSLAALPPSLPFSFPLRRTRALRDVVARSGRVVGLL